MRLDTHGSRALDPGAVAHGAGLTTRRHCSILAQALHPCAGARACLSGPWVWWRAPSARLPRIAAETPTRLSTAHCLP